MKFHRTLGEFGAIYGRMKRDRFLKEFKDPVLVVDVKGAVFGSQDFEVVAAARVDDPTVMEIEEKAWTKQFVAFVRKEGRNDVSRITLGRLPENDIVLPHPSISKLHAHLDHDDRRGAWSISDAGSRFGTSVAGARVQPEAPARLESGAVIRFADTLPATFYTSADFYDFLQGRAQLGKF